MCVVQQANGSFPTATECVEVVSCWQFARAFVHELRVHLVDSVIDEKEAQGRAFFGMLVGILDGILIRTEAKQVCAEFAEHVAHDAILAFGVLKLAG